MLAEKKLLDHGFVRLLNISGPVRRTHNPAEEYDLLDVTSEEKYGPVRQIPLDKLYPCDAYDTDPALVARISFNNFEAGRSCEDDLRLCDYLMRNWHTSPFEMIEVWCEMKLPIFLARQFIRHRTSSVNEVSARYSVLPEEWYIPEVVGAKPTNGAKQGQENTLALSTQRQFKAFLSKQCQDSYDYYNWALSNGVAPEHARLFLHVNHYTHWVWKQDLHNLMHLMMLRIDGHAQVEAQAYATAIYEMLKQFLPHSMKLFDKYRRDQIHINNELEAARKRIKELENLLNWFSF